MRRCKTCAMYSDLMDIDLSRVVTVGSSCAGKTTFSRRLSETLGAPHMELDALHWLPGWVARDPQGFRALVAKAAEQDRWVADGNYGSIQDLLWPRATAVIWLNYPFSTVMWRGFRRTLGRTLRREELYSGNRETLRQAFFSSDSILWWIAKSYHRQRRHYRAIFDTMPFPHLATIEFQRPAESECFLDRIKDTGHRNNRGPAAGPELC